MKLDYDILAHEYAQHRRVHPEVLKGLITGGQLHRTAQVLEVGCGTGNYSAAIAQAVGCSCWGVEPSASMLSQARANTFQIRTRLKPPLEDCAAMSTYVDKKTRPPRRTTGFSPEGAISIATTHAQSLHLMAGHAEKLGLPGAFFDLVFSVDVIHHLTDRLAYFREAWRVLQPGGRFCTVTGSAEIIRQRRPLSLYFPETVAVDVERYPSLAELRRMLVETGFTQLKKQTVEFVYAISDLRPYRDKAFSCLHLISPAAFERGLREMERDAQFRPITGVSRYLLLWGTK